MILTFVTAIEASMIFSSWCRRVRTRRKEILLGGSTHEIKSLPILDRYLKQQTGNPTKMQIVAAQKVSVAIRHAVHTQAFEYLVLRIIQSVVARARCKSQMATVEVIL